MWWLWFEPRFIWIEPMTNPVPDTEVVKLPHRVGAPPIRHVLDQEVRIPAHLSASGCEQIERTCKTCGAVKITIIDKADNHRRAWRKGDVQVETYVTPLCEADVGMVG
jgi:hypothetical protein